MVLGPGALVRGKLPAIKVGGGHLVQVMCFLTHSYGRIRSAALSSSTGMVRTPAVWRAYSAKPG
jgi:hypothetical protein